MILWSAKNNSTYMTRPRRAKTLRTAVRDAKSFLKNELYGEGVITYYDESDLEYPIRQDEKSIHTKFRFVTRTRF